MDGAEQLVGMFNRLTLVLSAVGIGLISPVIGWAAIKRLLGDEDALPRALKVSASTLPFIVGPSVFSTILQGIVKFVVGVR